MMNYYQPNNFINPMATQTVVKVNGFEGAKAYGLPPNSSILLLDETAPIVYLKVTDGASYPTITAYSISPIELKGGTDLQSLELRIAKLEEALNDHGKSNIRNAKQHKSAESE
jgi:hypothetical protein